MTSWTPRHLATLLSHKKPLSRRAERLTENDICGPALSRRSESTRSSTRRRRDVLGDARAIRTTRKAPPRSPGAAQDVQPPRRCPFGVFSRPLPLCELRPCPSSPLLIHNSMQIAGRRSWYGRPISPLQTGERARDRRADERAGPPRCDARARPARARALPEAGRRTWPGIDGAPPPRAT